jgi:uncharacterized phage-associated protein
MPERRLKESPYIISDYHIIMPTAMDVANFFIDLFKDSDDPMTHLRVEKFVYEAQAWSLVKLGKPLFEEEIEAWRYGPVIPSVYNTLNFCGRDMIYDTKGEFSGSAFSHEQKMLLINVARKLSKYSVSGLIEKMHIPDGPWATVYMEGENRKIPKRSLSDYYRRNETLEEFDLENALEKHRRTWPKDANGRTLVPHDLDESVRNSLISVIV